jgi:hypothetical protein
MGDVIMIKLKKEKIGIPIYFLNKESKINRSTEKINYFSFPVFFLNPVARAMLIIIKNVHKTTTIKKRIGISFLATRHKTLVLDSLPIYL